jgi:hypothetical protein
MVQVDASGEYARRQHRQRECRERFPAQRGSSVPRRATHDPEETFTATALSVRYSASAAVPPCVVPVGNEVVSCRSAVNQFERSSSIGANANFRAKAEFCRCRRALGSCTKQRPIGARLCTTRTVGARLSFGLAARPPTCHDRTARRADTSQDTRFRRLAFHPLSELLGLNRPAFSHPHSRSPKDTTLS